MLFSISFSIIFKHYISFHLHVPLHGGNMKRLSILSLSIFAISNQILFTQIDNNIYLNEVVVSATKTNTTLKKVGSSIQVITNKEIKESGLNQLSDILKNNTSLFVTNNGGVGSTSSIFLRGSNSEHVLFLIDGIRFHDNSSPTKSPSLNHISLGNVERVEILKGAQSTIWGSDAMAGVVNIITKKGSENDYSELYLEYGSHSTLQSQFQFSGGSESLDYYFNLNRTHTDGFSAKSEKRGNTEDDAYKSLNVDLSLNFKGSKNQNTQLTIKRNESKTDYDGFGNEYGFYNDETQSIFALSHDRIGGNGLYEEQYKYSLARVNRDAISTTAKDHYDSKDQNLSYQRSYYFDKHTLTAGIEHLNSNAFFKTNSSKLDSNNTKVQSLFINDLIEFNESFKLQVGGRKDNISKFGSQSSYRISPSYTRNKLRFYYSLSTGFKAPSLYQLYNGTGNQSLLPSKSKSVDLGFDYQLNQNTIFGLTKFKNDYRNLISYQSFSFATNTASYVNLQEVDTFGYEAYVKYKLSKKSKVSYNYNRTTARDNSTKLALLRRPTKQHTISLFHQFNDENSVNIDYSVVGSRVDAFFDNVTFTTVRTNLDSYKLLNLSYQHKLSEDNSISLRLHNITDEEYEEVYGFGTSKRAVYLGVTKRF